MVPMAHSFAEKPKSSRLKVGVPAVQVPRKKCDSVFCGCEICVEKSGEFSVPLKTHAVRLASQIFCRCEPPCTREAWRFIFSHGFV